MSKREVILSLRNQPAYLFKLNCFKHEMSEFETENVYKELWQNLNAGTDS